MPLPTTFAGVSSRGEGGFIQLSNGVIITGGTIYSDANYYYSTYTSIGTDTFTIANGNILADILVVGGGGGGGATSSTAGGGGAGGVRYYANQLLTSGSYTVVVGGGGSPGNNGSNSSFGSLTVALGGGRGAQTAQSANSGGSGGGGAGLSGYTSNGGSTSNSGEGNSGGPGRATGGAAGGGGGGAGGNGVNASSNYGGSGGPGISFTAFASATSTGSSGYYGGGGGGAGLNNGNGGIGGGGNKNANGVNTSGGGGGGNSNGGTAGGSGGNGVVIVRYLKPKTAVSNLWFMNGSGPTYPAKITTTGTITTYGSLGAGSQGNAMCLGPDGNLWIAGGAYVYSVTPSGVSTAYATGANANDICVGPDNNLWASTTGGTILQITTSGTITSTGGFGYGWNTIYNGSNGRLLLSSTLNGQVGAIDANISTPNFKISNVIFTSPYKGATQVNGKTWIIDNQNFTSINSSTLVNVTTYNPALDNGNWICQGPDGNAWVTGQTNHVSTCTMAGTITNYSVPSNYYASICSGPDGNLWVASGGTSVSKITTSGSVTTYTGVANAMGICAGP